MRKIWTRWALLAGAVLLLSSLAAAQAWVPERGEGEYSVIYQNLYTGDHLTAFGQPLALGHSRVIGVIQAVDFGLTDKWAVSSAFPIMAGKYSGAFPHMLPIDNGNYHGGVGDMSTTLRYRLREKPLALTPFISLAIPPHGYEYFAQSAIGSDIWQLTLGLNAGRRLDPVLRNGYFQARYGYTIAEKTTISSPRIALRPNRSRADAELGYFVTRRLTVRALMSSQIVHGALDDTSFPPPIQDPNSAFWRHHDLLVGMDYVNAGAGMSFAVSDAWNVFASWEKTAWIRNGPALTAGISAGMSWTFRTPWARKPTLFGGTGAAPRATERVETPALKN
jgi:hypothetical protein